MAVIRPAARGATPLNDIDAGRRIDRWLWSARLIRTRSAAAALVQSGRIRLFRAGAEWTRIAKASFRLAPRDILTVPLGRGVKVVEVIGFAPTRGAPAIARQLYADLTDTHTDRDAPAGDDAGTAGQNKGF